MQIYLIRFWMERSTKRRVPDCSHPLQSGLSRGYFCKKKRLPGYENQADADVSVSNNSQGQIGLLGDLYHVSSPL